MRGGGLAAGSPPLRLKELPSGGWPRRGWRTSFGSDRCLAFSLPKCKITGCRRRQGGRKDDSNHILLTMSRLTFHSLWLSALLLGGCSAERPAGEASEDARSLVLSDSVCARPEKTLSSSAVLPDSVFGRISHLDLHSDVFAVVDALGKFVAVVSYDLDVLQVVGRPGQGPGELTGPVASRLDDRRILVMDQASRRIWAYHRALSEGVGAQQSGFEELAVDLRGGLRASMGTDFAVLEDENIAIPVHEGPTYVAVAGASGERISTVGPVHRSEASLEQSLGRVYDRVATFDHGLLVWDDDEATLILFADRQEERWRLPDPYRRRDEPRTIHAPDGRGVAISIGQPSMAGWTTSQESICMAVRPSGVRDEVDLLWLAWDGVSAPVLRAIDTGTPGEPVSCGLIGEHLLLVNETEIQVLWLDDSGPCQGR